MKRKSIFKLLTTTLALAIVGGGAALLGQDDTVTASAASTFTMGDKAAVRVGDDATDSGIRFYAHMDADTRAKAQSNGYGFLIFPQSYLGTVTDDYHDTTKIKDYVEIVGDPSLIYANQDGGYTAHGVLAPVNHFEKDFTCVAWVAESALPENYGDDGVEYEGEFTYATVDSAFSRSAYQVASAAYIEEADKRDGLVAAYTTLGTATNPVLITSVEQLEIISEDVADGTTTFADVNFKLNSDITLSDDFASIGSAFEGTIDGNGKTITANYSAMIVEDYTDFVTGTAVEVVTSDDPIASIITVDENTVSRIDNEALSIEESYAAKTDWEAAGITANGYTGNARVFTVTSESAKNNSGYRVTMPEMNARQKAQLLETYTHVKFWIAVDRGTSGTTGAETAGSETTTVLSKGTVNGGLGSLVALANGSQYNVTATAGNYNTWIPFTVSIDTFFEAVGANTSFTPFCTYQDSDTLRKFYVGDFELIVADVPETLTSIVQSSKWSETTKGSYTTAPIYENDDESYFTSAEDVAALNFSGSYTGPAVRVERGAVTRENYYIARHSLSSFTINNALENTYTHVRFYVAVTFKTELHPDQTEGDWYFTAGNGILQYAAEATDGAFRFNSSNKDQWLEFNVPIADFIAYTNSASETGKVELFNRTGSSYWNGATKRDYIWFYFGEVKFVNNNA